MRKLQEAPSTKKFVNGKKFSNHGVRNGAHTLLTERNQRSSLAVISKDHKLLTTLLSRNAMPSSHLCGGVDVTQILPLEADPRALLNSTVERDLKLYFWTRPQGYPQSFTNAAIGCRALLTLDHHLEAKRLVALKI